MAKIKKQKKGNIVRIEGHKGEWLVTSDEVSYHFYAVSIAAVNVVTGAVDDAKGKWFSNVGPASSLPKAVVLSPGDVTHVGKAKFRTVTTVLHYVKSTSLDRPA